MTSIKIEILKILLDKGLLALILLVAGFYLNKIMERYRSQNTFSQKLAEAKIQAYLEVSKSLSELFFQIKSLADILETVHLSLVQNTANLDASLDDLDDVAKKFSIKYYETSAIIGKNLVFISPDVAISINENIAKVGKFIGAFKKITPPSKNHKANVDAIGEKVSVLRGATDEVLFSFSQVQAAITRGIHQNPFH